MCLNSFWIFTHDIGISMSHAACPWNVYAKSLKCLLSVQLSAIKKREQGFLLCEGIYDVGAQNKLPLFAAMH